MRIGVVLAGGASSQSSSAEPVLPPVLGDPVAMAGAVVVAADSGVDLARRIGLVPTLVVGDFDSVSRDGLQWATERGIEMRSSPADKDETDLELALTAAAAAGVDRIVVIGGDGGRFDHLLANVAVIARTRAALPIEAWMGEAMIAVVDDHWAATIPPGATLSVLAWNGPAVVSETGVRWPLDRHALAPGSTLGVSNSSLGGPVDITVHEGTVLVIVPNAKDLT